MLPALFVSHGSPMLALTDSPARDFLRGLGRTIGRPSAILVASAHWETPVPTLNAVVRNATIHDFYGFPPELFAMRYEPPGAPDLARRAAGLLAAAGFETALDTERGLDHGTWVPLSLMYPEADIPVLQVGIQSALDPAHHWRVGRALAPLRSENVLVMGSGSFTHNLSQLRRGVLDGTQPDDVVAFSDWRTCWSTGPGRHTRCGSIRRMSICCRCMSRWAPAARRSRPSGYTVRRCIQVCGWMPIRFVNSNLGQDDCS
jgi:4,5-DOPA dioxygenase extradiol